MSRKEPDCDKDLPPIPPEIWDIYEHTVNIPPGMSKKMAFTYMYALQLTKVDPEFRKMFIEALAGKKPNE